MKVDDNLQQFSSILQETPSTLQCNRYDDR